jgi:phosphoheptose isomerase
MISAFKERDMDKDQIAALDRAATQGDANALTDLEMALVGLYRTGKLVLIDDGAVEADALHDQLQRMVDRWEVQREALERIAEYSPAVTHEWAEHVRGIACTALGRKASDTKADSDGDDGA